MSLVSRLAAAAAVAMLGSAPSSAAVPHRNAAVSAVADPAARLRERIAADYALAGGATAFAPTDYTAADLRRLIRDRIDPALLNGAMAMRGSDYRFTPADGAKRHVGLVTIRYATPAIAAARARPLLGDKRFFRGTLVLTPMVVAARGDTAVVFFTESAGDPKLRAALAATAAHYRDR